MPCRWSGKWAQAFGALTKDSIVGNFYTNFTVRGPAQEQVVDALRTRHRQAFVSPAVNEMVVIYDAECDQQNADVIVALGRDLSAALACPILGVLNHDDDILCYWLFQRGELLDEYNSCPDYFEPTLYGQAPAAPAGGDVGKLCSVFATTIPPQELEAILRAPSSKEGGFMFQMERHIALAQALGLPEFSVGAGYQYLEQGEAPEIAGATFVRVD